MLRVSRATTRSELDFVEYFVKKKTIIWNVSAIAIELTQTHININIHAIVVICNKRRASVPLFSMHKTMLSDLLWKWQRCAPNKHTKETCPPAKKNAMEFCYWNEFFDWAVSCAALTVTCLYFFYLLFFLLRISWRPDPVSVFFYIYIKFYFKLKLPQNATFEMK